LNPNPRFRYGNSQKAHQRWKKESEPKEDVVNSCSENELLHENSPFI
jgi:hypothetical protein